MVVAARLARVCGGVAMTTGHGEEKALRARVIAQNPGSG